jgi:calmodulin-lysine N-methyltransferase
MSVPSVDSSFSVKVRFLNGPTDLKNLVGFNNTGNICLWPSEEIMTYFCVKNSSIFDNKSVCELGGGMTCLAGLMISKCSQPKEVFLTDGNEASFENLEAICCESEFECSVECCLLQWDKNTNYGDLEGRFDYIICADCLFFDDFREDLGATIYKLLKKDGTCLIFAPNRKNTFHKFVDMAKVHFECMIVHDYDLELWEKHLNEKENNQYYDEDVHYPLLLKLKKRTKSTNDFCKMVL